MTGTNQQTPLPTLRPGDSHAESLIEAAIQGHASTREAMRWLVRQLVPPQARAQVQGEPLAWVEHHKGGDNLVWDEPGGRKSPLYTTPQPAQAAQAEVTDGIRPEDFTVDVVVKPMGGFAPVNTQGVRVTHKPTGISVTCDAARSQHTNRHQAFEKLSAILALRPERVPMTPASRDVIMATRTANADADEWPEPWAYQRGWNDAEAHHGINAQAKKETP